MGMAAAVVALARRVWILRRDPVARRQSQLVFLGLIVAVVPWMISNLVSDLSQ
jgi:hypothetical protein